MSNKFPGDDADDFSDIRSSVTELQALLKNRAPLTHASKGWVIGAMSTPSTPDSGGHLYADGDDPYWKDSSGNNRSIIQTIPQGFAVDNSTAQTYNPPSTYQPAHIQTITDSVENLTDTLNLLLSSLRGAGLIDT